MLDFGLPAVLVVLDAVYAGRVKCFLHEIVVPFNKVLFFIVCVALLQC